MSDKVRWGLLSTANINKRLIPAIRLAERSDLVAVASRSLKQADAYADEWDIPQAFGSYEAMLTSGEVDAVYISLPNHLHAEWTIKALDAGVHVLCEKPFALTLDEVDDMTAASERNNRVLAEAFMYRHHPQTKTVGEWVAKNRLGDLTMVRGIFNFKLTNPDNIRLAPEKGGGSLWDVGIYPLSFAQYVAGGPPLWVSGDQRLGSTGVDEVFAGQLHYPNGMVAQISSSLQTPWYTYAEVLGTEGRLVLNRPFTGLTPGERSLLFVDAENAENEIPVQEKELYLGEVEDMEAAILDGSPPYLTLRETRDHVHTILALLESARRGERVYVEEVS